MPAKLEPLAIHGGTPVRKTLLPYGRQSLDDNDIQAVVSVLKSDWLTTGPKVAQFEEAFASRVGARFAVSSVLARRRSMEPRSRQILGLAMKRSPRP